jgi:UDP-GlcNAc3NAcA epimerase
MKIVTIVGARPQFIKAAMVTRIVGSKSSHVKEVIVHTGQHYDYKMSQIFFDQLIIPEPDYHLEIGSGRHGDMTGRMLSKVEEVLIKEQPDCVLVYGDTNSTLSGALAAAKLHIPVAHVEAGLRSFNRQMPEEINRVLTDHMAQLLFAPTDLAVINLQKEGIVDGVFKPGDVMFDAYLHHKTIARDRSSILDVLGVESDGYYLATVHRQENADDPDRLKEIFRAFETVGDDRRPVVIPLHPRTRKALACHHIEIGPGIKTIDPVGYLDMIKLEQNAKIIFTDSGGVQKEACFAGVPCVTLRNETEWVETVEAGINFIAGAQYESIIQAFDQARCADCDLKPDLYGNGHAAEAIVECFMNCI